MRCSANRSVISTRSETKAKVREAATSLGYVPNRHAQAMRTGRGGGVVLALGTLEDPWGVQLATRVRDQALAQEEVDQHEGDVELHRVRAVAHRVEEARGGPQLEALHLVVGRLRREVVRQVQVEAVEHVAADARPVRHAVGDARHPPRPRRQLGRHARLLRRLLEQRLHGGKARRDSSRHEIVELARGHTLVLGAPAHPQVQAVGAAHAAVHMDAL